jgi:hypothetical protein
VKHPEGDDLEEEDLRVVLAEDETARQPGSLVGSGWRVDS